MVGVMYLSPLLCGCVAMAICSMASSQVMVGPVPTTVYLGLAKVGVSPGLVECS